jgi:hypothetical protein
MLLQGALIGAGLIALIFIGTAVFVDGVLIALLFAR